MSPAPTRVTVRGLPTPGTAVSTTAMHASTIAAAIAPTTRAVLLIPSILPCARWRSTDASRNKTRLPRIHPPVTIIVAGHKHSRTRPLHGVVAWVWLPNLLKVGEHKRSIAVFIPTLNGLAYVPTLATLGSELRRTPLKRSSRG